ncbi:MAG: hypothetical protein DHS80DRAFT_30658 [Piptocephalis tieghemiana]|nr:MAG: hypothetical protein DHS80DRAFT_30658 [Piptocephalis tieghemiana]
MSALEKFMDRSVMVVTLDGRILVGNLVGFDQTTNIILSSCHERVFSLDTGMERQPLGLHILRGDNICVIGEVDGEMDESLDFPNIKALPIAPLRH